MVRPSVVLPALLALLCLGCRAAGEEVRFANGDVVLSGTLLRPDTTDPVPAVVLVHGSGETDRDSLRYYADLFVRDGYAALVYDKRGVGKSGGDPDAWRRFDFADLGGDAAAAVHFLATRDDVDGEHIGLFGASQGGWVAPLAATQSQASFLVLLSPSVTTVAEDRLFERAARLRSEGFTEEEVAEATAMQRVDQELTRHGANDEELAQLWDQNLKKRWFRRVYLGDEPEPAHGEWREWYRTVLDFDPVPLLQKAAIPTLCLFGDPALDRFGPVQASVDRLHEMREAGLPVEVVVYEGADHNLRRADTGEEAPFKDDLSAWLAKRGR